MRVTHPCSWQTWRGVLLALSLAACATEGQQDSIWPPADFELVVEETALAGVSQPIERRFRASADGLVVYGVATGVVRDEISGSELPVYGALAIYELVPICTRALSRRVFRAGVLELDSDQGQREGEVAVGTELRWRAFDRCVTLTSRGRVHGGMAEILAIVGSHLPAGEQFVTPGVAERGLAPVLRGVPAVREDPQGALQACLDLMDTRGVDAELALDAFALACSLGRRALAEDLLDRWSRAAQAAPAVAEEGASRGSELSAEHLARMLPLRGS